MEIIKEFVRAIFADQLTNTVIVLLIVGPLIDFATGLLRSIADKTFVLPAVDVFVRTQYAGRALPLTFLLILGRIITVSGALLTVIPGIDFSALVGLGGVAAAVPFLVKLINSIIANLNPGADNPIPTVDETPSAP